jgi:hypothetical protein
MRIDRYKGKDWSEYYKQVHDAEDFGTPFPPRPVTPPPQAPVARPIRNGYDDGYTHHISMTKAQQKKPPTGAGKQYMY